MGYRVKLRFGNYNLYYKGSSINFKVGEWVELDEDVALRLKGVHAGIEDKVYPYFDVEEVAEKKVEPAPEKEGPVEPEVTEAEGTEAHDQENKSAPAKKGKNAKKK